MGSYVLGLREIDQTQVEIVGGKGAHLGELSRIEGIRVPAGFCVTTYAFRRIMEDAPSIDARLDRLSRLRPADPVTSNRKVVSVEASFGLGEALVSGLVNADVYKVRDGEVVAKAVAPKQLGIHASPAGGTREEPIEPERQAQPALTDAQVLRLAQLGRRIEEHFGHPQDIEWCLVDDDVQILQSRPITTLFPIPVTDDGGNHVFVSVGHGQMMTDAMKPLGISMWQLTALPRMYEAGGRLFVDVTQRLASPTGRASLLEVMGRGDPLIRDALETILERDGFIPSLPDEGQGGAPIASAPAPLEADPAIVAELIARTQASIDAMKRDIRTKSGPILIDFILADIQ